MSHLKDRVVLVTGGASGFGREITTQLARGGATPVALDLNATGAEELAASLTAEGHQARGLGLDVRDRQAFADVVDRAVADLGRVDVLVNNAGIMPLAHLADHRKAADAWDRCIDINLKGVLHGIYAVHDHMLRQGGGHILNISSVYGNAGIAGAAVYGATKAAVATLSNALRVESQGRIKVTIVRPSGVVGTNLFTEIIDFNAPAALAAHRASTFQEHIQAFAGGTLPTGLTDPEDVRYWSLNATQVATEIVRLIDQPLGVAVTDITLRATGEDYVF
ncbi:SDR family oxidoreductase [Frankia sp. CNm7]|uniref:SDR family oxidoreductase n=1 Tax=Frankia nepalensis TaxID=1836974 RepID=A0A937RNQ3_9ACTN|nr:SDR family oxidoreductase [Frankia nepalensis]MBL7495755.1 SDR family oxidoreductase [Frankia nepalensis]MBL7509029.1 SDR family oxidoreductase [Frankia nepalensis]MBL7523460.1 SDR family oxidoreductase [Frankia nepalensis]MBL7629828.1 SDR family oxidoreductase [Frankia nepalensis]